MHDRYASRGEQIDLAALLQSLGVSRDGHDPDDSKPLAWIRRGIVDSPRGAVAVATPPAALTLGTSAWLPNPPSEF